MSLSYHETSLSSDWHTLTQGCQLLVNFGNGKQNRILNNGDERGPWNLTMHCSPAVGCPHRLWFNIIHEGAIKEKSVHYMEKVRWWSYSSHDGIDATAFTILRLDSVQFNIMETFLPCMVVVRRHQWSTWEDFLSPQRESRTHSTNTECPIPSLSASTLSSKCLGISKS